MSVTKIEKIFFPFKGHCKKSEEERKQQQKKKQKEKVVDESTPKEDSNFIGWA